MDCEQYLYEQKNEQKKDTLFHQSMMIFMGSIFMNVLFLSPRSLNLSMEHLSKNSDLVDNRN